MGKPLDADRWLALNFAAAVASSSPMQLKKRWSSSPEETDPESSSPFWGAVYEEGSVAFTRFPYAARRQARFRLGQGKEPDERLFVSSSETTNCLRASGLHRFTAKPIKLTLISLTDNAFLHWTEILETVLKSGSNFFCVTKKIAELCRWSHKTESSRRRFGN